MAIGSPIPTQQTDESLKDPIVKSVKITKDQNSKMESNVQNQ